MIVAVALVVAAIALFYAFSEVSTLLRVLGLIAAVVVAVLIASRTSAGAAAFSYIGDTQTEVRKVVWPTRQETIQTTMVVILMVIVVAIMLWAFDSLLGWAVRTLTF
ncbi:preprotein translocase subunit SecE [Methylophaga frappieri]|uniref:preprotein translocase subunit SecE n=1 Tax=Methylophaga frappieri (strain ATCC BAA-2434 / DSM 25690 / JAM7) TaxID=754477 RepID=UPI001EE68E14|nr:preprotein translocase subunit SecE [Methylophaga frappieri]